MLQQVFGGLVMGFIYTLVALGYNIIFATSGVINFAQGELVMLGALFGLSLFVALKVPFVGVLASVVLIVGIVSILLYKVAVEPLGRDPSAIGWVITTLGFGIIMRNLAMFGWGRETLSFPAVFPDKPLIFFRITVLPQELLIIFAAIFMVIFIEVFYSRTIFGKAIRATAHDHKTARLMGIDANNIITVCFLMSGGLSAIAGVLISPITFASAEMGAIIGLKGFAAAILGGLGNSRGALVGGLLLGVLEALVVGIVTPGFKDAIAFFLMICILLIKPGGITGAILEKKV